MASSPESLQGPRINHLHKNTCSGLIPIKEIPSPRELFDEGLPKHFPSYLVQPNNLSLEDNAEVALLCHAPRQQNLRTGPLLCLLSLLRLDSSMIPNSAVQKDGKRRLGTSASLFPVYDRLWITTIASTSALPLGLGLPLPLPQQSRTMQRRSAPPR